MTKYGGPVCGCLTFFFPGEIFLADVRAVTGGEALIDFLSYRARAKAFFFKSSAFLITRVIDGIVGMIAESEASTSGSKGHFAADL